MAKRKPTTDEKIINSGAMQYLMPFPAAGRRLRVTRAGAGLTASIADDLRGAAVPFSRALGSLRVDQAQTKDQAIVWAGPLQYVMPLPAEGRLLQVKAEGTLLAVSIADGLGHANDAIPFTAAFRSLHVEPVVDPDAPYAPYYPGASTAYQHRSQYGDAKRDSQHAETSED